MIKLSDNWCLGSDKYQWILKEYYDGTNKKGELTRYCRNTYHATLHQVASHIAEQELKAASSIQEIKRISEELLSTVALNLKQAGLVR